MGDFTLVTDSDLQRRCSALTDVVIGLGKLRLDSTAAQIASFREKWNARFDDVVALVQEAERRVAEFMVELSIGTQGNRGWIGGLADLHGAADHLLWQFGVRTPPATPSSMLNILDQLKDRIDKNSKNAAVTLARVGREADQARELERQSQRQAWRSDTNFQTAARWGLGAFVIGGLLLWFTLAKRK